VRIVGVTGFRAFQESSFMFFGGGKGDSYVRQECRDQSDAQDLSSNCP
jgi:hypothetical protein